MKTSESSLRISLEQVRLYGYHGVFPQERDIGAEFELNVDIEIPIPEGCVTDTLDGTISYAEVYEVLCCEFDKPSALIENVAERINRVLRHRWPQIVSSRINVRKLSPPIQGFQGTASVTLIS